MLSVFICEDDVIQKENLERFVSDYIMIEQLDMELTLSTDNPQDILDYLKRHPKTAGLYFLDINLGHAINGIALAKEIRGRDLTSFIVFITTHSELAMLTLSLNIEALDYIVKVEDPKAIKERVRQCIAIAHRRYTSTQSEDKALFQIDVDGKLYSFPVSDIMFFETSTTPHRITLHLENSQHNFRYSLRAAERAHPDFLKVHGSYVANTENIDFIDQPNKLIQMHNGATCPVSVRGMKALKDRLKEKS